MTRHSLYKMLSITVDTHIKMINGYLYAGDNTTAGFLRHGIIDLLNINYETSRISKSALIYFLNRVDKTK